MRVCLLINELINTFNKHSSSTTTDDVSRDVMMCNSPTTLQVNAWPKNAHSKKFYSPSAAKKSESPEKGTGKPK